ncbi:MAG: carbon-nitrogen hydrolase family protein [Bacteroidota bacterium]
MNKAIKIAAAQIAPIWLDKIKTTEKIIDYIEKAGEADCQLVAFGETLLPGYPFWLDFTDGARFNSDLQKDLHAYYVQQAVQIENGDLDGICATAKEHNIAVVLGIVERAADRGGHSVYCTMVYIHPDGTIGHTHRKLMPTYEERLCWSPGDGHGLQVQQLGDFTVGALNCWENWMPLPRAALYGLGEDLHIAIWPGNVRNTEILTRFLAREGRSYVISTCGLFRKEDIPKTQPHYDFIYAQCSDMPADGGSCIAAPDGSWLVEPLAGKEELIIAEANHQEVLRERQNFDAVGHYSRPDVTKLIVNRERQSTVEFK